MRKKCEGGKFVGRRILDTKKKERKEVDGRQEKVGQKTVGGDNQGRSAALGF